jgi:tRNA wybutosine-synthesizing protein 3
MPNSSHIPPPLPQTFQSKKSKILSSLSIPSTHYTDLSPKGSVDAAILPLIHQINAIDGLVTTSSCAGRISVFLEGRRGKGRGNLVDGVGAGVGGKGRGGRWLFVSHDPLKLEKGVDLMKLFGLEGDGEKNGESSGKRNGMRVVRFQFEPMVLPLSS